VYHWGSVHKVPLITGQGWEVCPQGLGMGAWWRSRIWMVSWSLWITLKKTELRVWKKHLWQWKQWMRCVKRIETWEYRRPPAYNFSTLWWCESVPIQQFWFSLSVFNKYIIMHYIMYCILSYITLYYYTVFNKPHKAFSILLQNKLCVYMVSPNCKLM
jgi:hypothetical protein